MTSNIVTTPAELQAIIEAASAEGASEFFVAFGAAPTHHDGVEKK